MLDEYQRTEMSFHRPSGRFYARYYTVGPYEETGERERLQVRTFVYVLTGALERR
jgi:hypothetical protein